MIIGVLFLGFGIYLCAGGVSLVKPGVNFKLRRLALMTPGLLSIAFGFWLILESVSA